MWPSASIGHSSMGTGKDIWASDATCVLHRCMHPKVSRHAQCTNRFYLIQSLHFLGKIHPNALKLHCFIYMYRNRWVDRAATFRLPSYVGSTCLLAPQCQLCITCQMVEMGCYQTTMQKLRSCWDHNMIEKGGCQFGEGLRKGLLLKVVLQIHIG